MFVFKHEEHVRFDWLQNLRVMTPLKGCLERGIMPIMLFVYDNPPLQYWGIGRAVAFPSVYHSLVVHPRCPKNIHTKVWVVIWHLRKPQRRLGVSLWRSENHQLPNCPKRQQMWYSVGLQSPFVPRGISFWTISHPQNFEGLKYMALGKRRDS